MDGAITNVTSLLEAQADRRPDTVALVHGERSWTYAEVEARANRLANALLARGVQRGDRIALLADNGIESVAGLFGILKAGACAVALSNANKPHTNIRLLEDSGAVGLVARAMTVRRDLPELVAGAAALRVVVMDRPGPPLDCDRAVDLLIETDLDPFADERPALRPDAGDLALILYTSGSTGMPRGVTLTHGNLVANTRQILAYLELTDRDSILAVLPFHYSYGNSLLMTYFAVGGRIVVDNRFAYPQTILQTMHEQEVTGFAGVPSTYAILCAKTDFLGAPPPSLDMLTQAGGGMAPALIRRIREAFLGRARLFIMYGQTEASARLAYVPPQRLQEKIGSIGIPIPGVELEIRNKEGAECAVDEVGELVARGPNIMQGYWNDPQETELVLRGGELFTGDLGRKDEDGYIYLVDRIKNMIKAGANRVSSREIEDALAEIDGIVEACVVGVPDFLLGEAIEAHVVAGEESGLDEKIILAFLHQRLALFKIPRKIIFHNELPKNSAGKIMKKLLKNIK